MSFGGFSLRYLSKEDEWNGNDELDEEEEEDDELDEEDWDEDLEDEEDEEAKPLNQILYFHI